MSKQTGTNRTAVVANFATTASAGKCRHRATGKEVIQVRLACGYGNTDIILAGAVVKQCLTAIVGDTGGGDVT
jgi:hypothetical protein